MKAHEVEVAGDYWYFAAGQPKPLLVHRDSTNVLPFIVPARALANRMFYDAEDLPGEFIGPIEYPPADASELRAIATEMRERKVNNGKHQSPTLVSWAIRIDAILDRMGVPK